MTQKFFTGDRVIYVGTHRWSKNHIIHDCKYTGNGQFKYSTNCGAWFSEKEFQLVERATKQSFKELDKDLQEEGMLDDD